MALCSTLSRVQKSMVDFNPADVEHLKAFQMLCLGQNGVVRQHPTLRFHLDDNFPDVRSMMFHQVGEFSVRRAVGETWLQGMRQS